MPRYDYRCIECGHLYEKREGFDAPSLQTCPVCPGTARRVLTPPAIVFKGSGWYVNDSRKGAPDADGSPSTKAGGKSDGASPGSNPSPSTATESASKSAPKAEKTSA